MVANSSGYYQHGSTARKIKSEVQKESPIVKGKSTRVKYTRVKARIMLLMLVVFACAMAMVYRYALITDLNYKMDESKKSYNRIKNENITLRVKIENSLDLAQVRTLAETKIGMMKPQNEQLVSVSVPKADYINQNQTVISGQYSGKQSFINIFSRIARNVGLVK